ncbi:MAG: TetR/AcrR family transcriptional regulator [Novosphingobium sp.]|nr:TetR/AcrR family transcriptional regulator [Novosphingobium sp.]
MCDEGYSAVSSRRVAEVAGLKSQLVHYHFGSMDNLFLALFRRTEEDYLSRQIRSLTSTTPLRSLWEQSLQQSDARLTIEFLALARHSEAIGSEVRRANDMTRKVHNLIISDALEHARTKDLPPPEVLAFLIAAVSRTLGTEEALGTDLSHAAVHEYVEQILARFEPPET